MNECPPALVHARRRTRLAAVKARKYRHRLDPGPRGLEACRNEGLPSAAPRSTRGCHVRMHGRAIDDTVADFSNSTPARRRFYSAMCPGRPAVPARPLRRSTPTVRRIRMRRRPSTAAHCLLRRQQRQRACHGARSIPFYPPTDRRPATDDRSQTGSVPSLSLCVYD